MSFEELGQVLDRFADQWLESVGDAIRRMNRSMQALVNPAPAVEGRELTEDLCREGYDVVERNSVRVERVEAEQHGGEAATVRYDDGSEWSQVTRYDLTEIEDSLEGWGDTDGK